MLKNLYGPVSWHQQNHTTSLHKSDVDNYLQLFHVHYHKPTLISSWVMWVLSKKHVTNHLEQAPIERHASNWLYMAAGS